MILCRYLCNRLQLNFNVAGSQVIPADGKGQFPLITKLFRLIDKDGCILTDLDGFTDNNDIIRLFTTLPRTTEIAKGQDCNDLQSMIREAKSDIAKMISANHTSVKKIYESHPYGFAHFSNDRSNQTRLPLK